ncbi:MULTISPECIES: PTS transporter subunit EIIC [Klebsiella]|jgi:PTS system beta-glucosides-specific IIC component|nr:MULTISPECIES: PTS transporter subunit EIIC [unclassified Klebsiella]MBW5980373.1 PTS beta-glucoside transporter subunit IIABC [Klebsiella michiganensis]MBW6012081.1 PTS beta-glucoside transporter subunit IIABC [Klebsiella sp. CVUAS 11263]MBW6033792.1 PTS beta-glucoside transporter subunit IIABC [Klebsiella sp. CVUAS 11332]
MDYRKIADEIIKNIGGIENVKTLTHCMTRLRFVLKNEEKVNEKELRNISGVLGIARGMGQQQVVMGKNLAPTFKAITDNYPLNDNPGEVHAEAATKSKKPTAMTFKKIVMEVVNFLGASVSPMIVGLVAGGMLKIVLLLTALVIPDIKDTQTYTLIGYISDVPFYFMPVLLAYGASRKLGCNTIYAVLVACVLLSPGFTGLVTVGAETNLFGIPVPLINYAGSFIPVILSTITVYYLERFLNSIMPGILRSFMVGMLTVGITSFITLVAWGPLGTWAGFHFVSFLVIIQNTIGPIALGVLAAVLPFIVMAGMHSLFAPFMVQSLAIAHFDGFFRPALILHNVSEGGACLAIALRTRNSSLRGEALSLGFGCIVAGVSEPAIYGLMLKLKRPLYGVMAGGAAGGVVAGLMGAKAFVMGRSTILALPIFQDTIVAMIAGLGVAFIVSFIVAFIVGFEDITNTENIT